MLMICRRTTIISLLFAVPALAIPLGCSRPKPELPPAKPADVTVESPILKSVTEYEDFTGRAEAVNSVDVRARVTGYLKQIHFKDGEDVEQGKVLMEIDSVLYEAERDRAESTLAGAKAHVEQEKVELIRAQKDFDRLSKSSTGTSSNELDKATADRDKARSSIVAFESAAKVAAAQLKIAQQNLEWTVIKAPISGRLSRRAIDAGNLVKADDTVLTSIVSLDPIAVNFDIDDRTMLRVRRLIQKGEVKSAREAITFVDIALPDEEAFAFRKNKIDFLDNRLDAGTGTLRMRAVVDNPPSHKSHLISPGQFVRVRLPIGEPHDSVLVPEEAIGTNQDQKFVYVVNDKDEVEERRLKLGQQHEQYREVLTGLTVNDRVITKGLQRVRPKAKVNPQPKPAPAPTA